MATTTTDTAEHAYRQHGGVLRELRLGRGWTLKDVEDRTGLLVTNICALECQRLSLGYKTAYRLGRAFNVPAETFLPED